MNQVTIENHATAKRDEVDATVREIMHDSLPTLSVHQSQNIKAQLKHTISKLYDKAVAEGRHLEIMEPSTPEEPEELILHKHKLRAKYKNDTGDHE